MTTSSHKHIVGALLIPLLLVFALTDPAPAQTSFNPKGISLFNTYSLASGASFIASQIDTFPSPSAGGLRVGAAKFLSNTVMVTDSAKIDVYADIEIRGSSTWTNVLADSLIFQSTGSSWKEFSLRSAAAEKFTGLDVVLRWRYAFRSSGQGVTSPKYTSTVNYKP